jgi:hypothetical protein
LDPRDAHENVDWLPNVVSTENGDEFDRYLACGGCEEFGNGGGISWESFIGRDLGDFNRWKSLEHASPVNIHFKIASKLRAKLSRRL